MPPSPPPTNSANSTHQPPASLGQSKDAVVSLEMRTTDDRETAELWRAELAAGRAPTEHRGRALKRERVALPPTAKIGELAIAWPSRPAPISAILCCPASAGSRGSRRAATRCCNQHRACQTCQRRTGRGGSA